MSYHCYKCGKLTVRFPLCDKCEIDNDYNQLQKENILLKECITFIANQKDKTGNWAVEMAKRTLREIELW